MMHALKLAKTGELSRRIRELYTLISPCTLCPRECGIDRLSGEKGFCGVSRLKVASYGPHFGEESCLVGNGGSGTIFFSGCNLNCIFCQNYTISHGCEGITVRVNELARIMMELQHRGCENINLVTPTHVVPFLVDALDTAIAQGLRLPVVYNCGGYESPNVLELLDGIVDIYLPDVKFASNDAAQSLAQAADYFQVACRAIRMMDSQVGELTLNVDGIASEGVLVRHLVLPNGFSGSDVWARILPTLLTGDGMVNLMDQYRPSFKAVSIPALNRRISSVEFGTARDAFVAHGLSPVD